jgi:hypothetical protein
LLVSAHSSAAPFDTPPAAAIRAQRLDLARRSTGSAPPYQRTFLFRYYRKAGKYTFEVRAFNAASADPTPAKMSFTIT